MLGVDEWEVQQEERWCVISKSLKPSQVAGINQGPRSQKMEPSSRTTVEAAEIGPAAQVVAAPPQSNLVEEEAQNWRALRAQQQQCVTHHSPRGGGAGRGAPVPASSPAAGARNQLMSSPQYGVQLPPTSPRKSGMAACSITGGPAESSGAPDPPTLGSPRHTPSTRPVALFRPDILVERGFNGGCGSPTPPVTLCARQKLPLAREFIAPFMRIWAFVSTQGEWRHPLPTSPPPPPPKDP